MGSSVPCWVVLIGTALLLLCPTNGQSESAHRTSGQPLSSLNGLEDGQPPQAAASQCFVRCIFQPTRSQQDIDLIAKDMTQQIVTELRNGQLTQQQLNEPLYFDRRVTSQLNQLDREKEHIRKFYHHLGFEEDRLARERESIELQRQLASNIFNQGQSYSHQRQTQQQTGQFQEQTHQLFTVPRETITSQRQVNHNTQQIHHQQQPIQVQYRPGQTIRQENRRTEERVVYNAPVLPAVESQQSSSQQTQQTGVTHRRRLYRPSIPVNNEHFHRTEEHRQIETTRQQPALPVIVPSTQSRIISSNQQTRQETIRQPPIVIPSSQSQIISTHQQTRQETIRQQPTIVLPTTQTITNQQQTRQESSRTNIPAPIPPPPPRHSSHREYHRSEQHVERIPPVPIVIKPPTYHQRQSTTRTESRSQSQSPRVTYTVAPVQNSEHHNTFARLDKFERDEVIVPNYSGRVKLNESRDVLVEHRRQQQFQPQPIPTTTTTTTRRIEELRRDLQRLRVQQPLSIVQLQEIIRNGYFRENNQVFVYNIATQHFEPTGENRNTNGSVTTITTARHLEPIITRSYERLSQSEYQQRLQQLDTELNRLGYNNVRFEMREEITRRGGFRHNGVQYGWQGGRIVRLENQTSEERNVQRPTVVVHQQPQVNRVVETKEEEYVRRWEELDGKIQQIKAINFNDFERNQTLETGVFIRNFAKYVYDNQTHDYVRETLSRDEADRIYERIQQMLKHYGYRQTTKLETDSLLDNGLFYRGGYRWVFESRNGAFSKSDQVGQFEELTQDEYQRIYDKVQQSLQQLGFDRFTEVQCNTAIVRGTFERGGIIYIYDAEQGIFIHEELTDIVFNQRLQVLRQKLVELGSRELTAEELRSIIYRGAFIYEGYRYEYNAETGLYDQVSISDEEYEYRLLQLQQQLQTIGYEHMTLVECNSTIYTGAFYFNGYDWLYNYGTNVYDRSDVETTSKRRDDETEYSRLTTETAEITTEPTEPGLKVKPTVNPGRGDQPPEVYVTDYEEEEEPVEQEPGLGSYPVPVDVPVLTQRVIENSDETEQRKADITLQQQQQEEEQRIRIYEEQRLEHEERVRVQEEQRLAHEEQLRLHEEQRLRDEEEAQAQSEQRRLQEEQSQREELERQRAERRAAEEAQQLEDQRRDEELRQENERAVHLEEERRQAESDRKDRERRENDERQRNDEEEEDVEDDGGDQEEGEYDEEEEGDEE